MQKVIKYSCFILLTLFFINANCFSDQDSSDFIKDNLTLTLGPAEVYIHAISATKDPITLGAIPPGIGKQYLQIKIEIKKLQSSKEFDTSNLLLTTYSGIKHFAPKVYMKLNENHTISESYTVLLPKEAFIIFFEIKEGEDITKLKLAYQPSNKTLHLTAKTPR
ncbi:MAG: hypothetical protein KAI43_12750, partial [Candidatus Aureabacteria bacterium]|nr:hypothetical protein [Candidatus Auribacterota bacterium]